MSDLNKLLENYFKPKPLEPEQFTIFEIIELVNDMMEKDPSLLEAKDAAVETEAEQKQLSVTMPIIRISEKMWGKEGSQDRNIIQNLLGKIVKHGTTLTDKIRLINDFLDPENPVETDDVSEILTNIVLLDTLTNIMVHFNASAAGFTFEGFLSALLAGKQVPAGTAGIQDLIDNDANPISLKLLTEKPGHVHGSYRDLVDHFIDPTHKETGAKRTEDTYTDPETGQEVENPHYVGKAGVDGQMTYVVALKSFREKEAAEALEGTEYIQFYQFDFTAETFFESLMSSEHNANLLLLPDSLLQSPEEQPSQDKAYDPLTPEQLSQLYGGKKSGYDPGTAGAYRKIISMFDSEYAMEILANAKLIPHPKNPKKMVLVGSDDEPIVYKPLPSGDVRWKKVGAKTYTEYLDFKTSVNLLRQALEESPERFWNLIAKTSGYEGSVKVPGHGSVTQFAISAAYYKEKNYDQDGFGYVGIIYVGRKAVTDLAQRYAGVLNQQIFDIFEQVQTLSEQINAYFVAGDKPQAMAAAETAKEIKAGTEEYAAQDIEQQSAMAAKE